jgi:hypothetical protein
MKVFVSCVQDREKTCALCQKEFSTPYNLRVHVREGALSSFHCYI